jgi:hypothetical protein
MAAHMESEFQIHLKRLKQHHDTCIEKYDEISLLDLSHALRMWADLKVPLSALPSVAAARVFKWSTPTKQVRKLVTGKKFIFAIFPGGLTLNPSLASEVSGPPRTVADHFYLIRTAAKGGQNSVSLFQYCFIAGKTAIDADTSLIKDHVCNFKEWLEKEAVLVSFRNSQGLIEERSISRNDLIRRTANILNGSHPAIANNGYWANVLDPAILYLAKVPVGKIPLLYLALLKISQDILETVPPLLGLTIAPFSVPHSDAESLVEYVNNLPGIWVPAHSAPE